MLFLVKFVWSLKAIEDKYLTNQIMDYFEDLLVPLSAETIAEGINKRDAEATASLTDTNIGSLQASKDLSRANHYWTRKRGRESTPGYPSDESQQFTLYPGRAFRQVVTTSSGRKKRETLMKLARPNKAFSRLKRESDVQVDSTTIKMETTQSNATTEAPKPSDNPREHSRLGPRGKHFNRRFGRVP